MHSCEPSSTISGFPSTRQPATPSSSVPCGTAPELLPHCICGRALARPYRRNEIEALACRCGVVRQVLRMTAGDLAAWYREHYHAGVYRHSVEHDLVVAGSRVRHYGSRLSSPVLDVGCGNGAFVQACRQVGLQADGQDLAATRNDLITAPIENIDGQYGTVTMHDVLEHAIDPAAMLAHARRLLELKGRLIVDFPDFFGPLGAHHWKAVEHLWMIPLGQLLALVERCGFLIDAVERPVRSKFAIFAEAA